MRVIKFRAWDKRFKKFDYGSGALLLRHNSNDFEEIQQYTGLKDKDGKKVFEGDVIEAYYNGDRFVGFVEFYKGCFYLNVPGDFMKSLSWWADIEIIGNVFENHKLIKDKTV